jgi:CubicO group peptidase (beta-lactamase class C family)
MRRLLAVLLLAVLATPSFADAPAKAPPPAAKSIPELKAQLEKILQEFHIPGMSVAVVRKDGPEWMAGLGLADVAAGTPNTASTLFRIGSTSKAFTSLSILQLVREGKVSLDTPVHQIIPDVWFENPWEATDPVRVVDLLEHTTGWDDMHFREYAKDAPGMSLKDGLDYDHSSRTSRWRPGTRMAYCNSGLGVAAAVVEKITGQRFEDYVEEHVFRPIGMSTATYMSPEGHPATTLYHDDGKRPFPYWNILIRPAGSINASAEDMAAYVQFYLNRGHAHDVAIVQPEDIDRMEVPTRSWAAQDGLRLGYGLSNYSMVLNGYVFHGHDGGVNGGLTDMAYLPDAGVGYFFSINSGNGAGFKALVEAMQAYVTRDLTRPALPAATALPAEASAYTGWYQPDSPRASMFEFLERISGLAHVTVDTKGLMLTGADRETQHYVPVTGLQLRRNDAPEHLDPVATMQLIKPNPEGRFIGVGGFATLKQIPAWMAVGEIALVAWFALALASVLLYAPFWMLSGLAKSRRKPADRALRLWPVVAFGGLIGALVVGTVASSDIIELLGAPTWASVSIFLGTLVFALASLWSAWVTWRAGDGVRRFVRAHVAFVSIILVIATVYLAYWGVIGIRTWA